MEFRILGPLEVLENWRQVELGGAKQRALLAILLLDANRVVSAERLIDSLWDDSPPEQARKALQVYVSQLRKALGKGRIVTRDPGYLLRVEAGALDLDRFLELRARGELEEALRLFRGEPLADFEGEPFADAEIARLRELRLATVEDRIDADLAAGRHGALVAELERLVAEHPLRERLRAQLMLALYRSGRQAEALAAFQDARRALVDELGIEPSRALRDLETAILRQDAALDLDRATDHSQEPTPEPAPPEPPPAMDVRVERKTVTAVHVHVAVTAATDHPLDPEVLRRVLTRAFVEVTAAIEAHEGTIETITGDSVTGVFGLPVVHEDDPLRASRATDDVEQRLAGLARELAPATRLETRIGVSTGEVMTGGRAGSGLRATGEPLIAAAALAQQAKALEALFDVRTRRAADARRDGSRFTSPMVGRARERRRLHDAFEQAAGDRSCQLFTILGTAGVGKSRLVEEFLGDLAGRALVARGRCLPYGEGITFWPVLEALTDLAGLEDADTPEEARARLDALLDEGGDAELVAQRITDLVGLTEGSSQVEDAFQAIRTYFALVASRRPLVVVFDDVHWGEGTFHDLVEHIAEWSRDTPLLLLCIARPELLDVRPGWAGGKLNATTVLLEPLSPDECGQLVSNLVGEDELAEEVEARIAEAAEGNPLFVEEMLSMLIDEGLLVREDWRWTVAGDIGAVPVPPTIQALLAARLDQLGDGERAVIERAAVEGKLFHRASVEELASAAMRPTVSSDLAALVRKELIRPEKPIFAGEDGYRFRHLLIRDAAYESTPKELRAELHERHADWLEERAGERLVEFEEILGYHLEQAFRYRIELGPFDDTTRALSRRAAEWLGSAGRRAFARSDTPAAANLISRAVALLPTGDPLRVDLVPSVRVIQGLSDLGWADAVLNEAIASGDPGLEAHALVQQGFLRLFTARDVEPSQLIEIAERAIGVFEKLEDELGLARAWRLVAQAHYLARRAGPCTEASEQALKHALRAGDRFEQREIVEWLGAVLWLGPAPAPEAAARCRRLLAEVPGNSILAANLLGALAYLVAIQGHSDEAEELFDRVLRLIEALGEEAWVFPIERAWVSMLHGDPAAAERELRPNHERLRAIGNLSHFCSVAVVLAQAVYAQGRYEEAEAYARDAAESAGPIEVHSTIVGRTTTAKVLARRGEFEAAERIAREAVAFAADSDFLDSYGTALTDLAEVLRLAGRPLEAAEAVEEAITIHGQHGNVLAVKHSRILLDELKQAGRTHRSGRA
jgi:DNA-binding SARP family transcriptional activator